MEQARPLMPNVELFTEPYAAAAGADAVVIVTEWDQLRALDLKRLAASMAAPVLVDLRNVYPPEDAVAAGLRWYGVGKPDNAPAVATAAAGDLVDADVGERRVG
jgi:UDPglucose 6-dehydrogenase